MAKKTASKDKPSLVLKGQIKTPPMSEAARIETGHLLRRLQKGGIAFDAPVQADAEYWFRLSRGANQ